MGFRDRGLDGPTFRMREKLFAIGDDYWIETDGGEHAFKVDGKADAASQDAGRRGPPAGEELFTVQERKLSVRDKMAIEHDGDTVATVKKALIGFRGATTSTPTGAVS